MIETVTETWRSWAALVGCFLMGTAFNAYIIAPASIFPLLMDDFLIDKPAAGLSISVLFLTWGLASLPGGFFMDRRDNRWLVLGGTVVFVLASIATALAPTYSVFLVARMVGGATGAFIWTANANIIGRVFPGSQLALGTGLFVTAGPAGQALAQFLGPIISATAGWPSVFFAYPGLAIVGVLILFGAIREPVRSEEAISIATFRRAVGNRDILIVSAAAACSYALFSFFNTWMPTYATEVLAIGLGTAGAAASLVPFAGIIVRPGGGWLSDRLNYRRRPVIAMSFLLVLPVTVGITLAVTAGQFAVGMVFAGGSVQLAIGVYYVFISELADPETTGTSLAMMSAISTFGALIAPVAGGWLIESISWTAGYGFAVLIAVLGVVMIYQVPESSPPESA